MFPLAMLRKQNTYILRASPSNSTQPSYQSTCASPLTNRRFCYLGFRFIAAQSHPYPVRRVPLLSGCLAVGLQNRVNEWDRRRQFRPLAFRNLAFRWHRATQRLPHLSTVHS